MTCRVLVHDLRTQDIGGHEVGRELNAAVVEPENDAERGDELGLGKSRNADKQRVPAGKYREQRLLDDALLTENDLADLGADQRDLSERRLGCGDDRLFVGQFGRAFHYTHCKSPGRPLLDRSPMPAVQFLFFNLDPAGRLTSRRRRTIS